MAFFEDPRLRQRWNQITHDAETVTENAAAGIWSFQHNYINPCMGSLVESLEQCTAVCLGDAEERLRKRRERDRARGRAEYSFDFYDDWYDEEEAENAGLLGSWVGEDWERLLAGTGTQRKRGGGETAQQPSRKRAMSYGTKGGRRKARDQDHTIIRSSQPIGFLSKLPWKIGGTLRYKPSAADLQDRPGMHSVGETEPLLGPTTDSNSSDAGKAPRTRQRSGTAGSGETSDSYRSRGDLFPSDGEGEEDAVPLDDDVTFDMIRKDDRSSGKTRSSRGKRPAGSRTVSRTTLGSERSRDSLRGAPSSTSLLVTPDVDNTPSLQDLGAEEERLRDEEGREVVRKTEAAAQPAMPPRGLQGSSCSDVPSLERNTKADYLVAHGNEHSDPPRDAQEVRSMAFREPQPASDAAAHARDAGDVAVAKSRCEAGFIPARLPRFG